LIGLARIGRLGLLPKLAKRIVVPAAVHAEVTETRADAPGAAEVAAQAWLEERAAETRWRSRPCASWLAGERPRPSRWRNRRPLPSCWWTIFTRKLIQRLGLRRMGTVALLGLAKREGLIWKLKPPLEALLAHGIFIRRELIDAARREAGE
jgi:predicted nucleic acid-binding protein